MNKSFKQLLSRAVDGSLSVPMCIFHIWDCGHLHPPCFLRLLSQSPVRLMVVVHLV